jgi:pyruvate/2-oxoglutarate dehydrogenase complex dihydrolipoamide acyltransferase (E2) component
MGKSVKEQLAILEKTRARDFQNYQNTGQGPDWVKKQSGQAPGASAQELAQRSVSGNWSQPQSQSQPKPQSFTPPPSANVPSGADRAAAEEQDRVDAENRARETARLADIEKNRYQRVSGKEGEQRRKEFESKSSAAASRATGAMGQKLPRPSINIVSPQKSILGIPKDSRQFTKFGESINRAANLTFSNPEARVGGM